jgi:hypothetical protein
MPTNNALQRTMGNVAALCAHELRARARVECPPCQAAELGR